MPTRRPSARAAPRQAGHAAEADFAAWLNRNRVPFLYAGQSRETFADGLKGKARHPDFLIGQPYLRLLAIDVKTAAACHESLIFDVAEIHRLQVFCDLFNATGVVVCIDPPGSPVMKWIPLRVFADRQVTTGSGKPVYVVSQREALPVDRRRTFARAVERLGSLAVALS